MGLLVLVSFKLADVEGSASAGGLRVTRADFARKSARMPVLLGGGGLKSAWRTTGSVGLADNNEGSTVVFHRMRSHLRRGR